MRVLTKKSATAVCLVALASILSIGQAAHQQWVKLSIANTIPEDQELKVTVHDFNLKWGHFYDCKDEKKKKIEVPRLLSIPSGGVIQVCSTGAKLLPAGVEGGMKLTIGDDGQVVYLAAFAWDSPLFKSKNVFNVTLASGSNQKLQLTCKDDYNKRGGALGNVDCTLEGSIKEKYIPPPPVPEVTPIVEEIIKEIQVIEEIQPEPIQDSDIEEVIQLEAEEKPIPFDIPSSQTDNVLDWIEENIRTIAVVAVIICGSLAVRYMPRQKKARVDHSGCSGCSHHSGGTIGEDRPMVESRIEDSQNDKLNDSQETQNPQDNGTSRGGEKEE